MELTASRIHLAPASGTSKSEHCCLYLEMQLRRGGRGSGAIALTSSSTTTTSTPLEVLSMLPLLSLPLPPSALVNHG